MKKTILKNLDKYCSLNELSFDVQIRYNNIPNDYFEKLKKNKIYNYDKILTRSDAGSSYKIQIIIIFGIN